MNAFKKTLPRRTARFINRLLGRLGIKLARTYSLREMEQTQKNLSAQLDLVTKQKNNLGSRLREKEQAQTEMSAQLELASQQKNNMASSLREMEQTRKNLSAELDLVSQQKNNMVSRMREMEQARTEMSAQLGLATEKNNEMTSRLDQLNLQVDELQVKSSHPDSATILHHTVKSLGQWQLDESQTIAEKKTQYEGLLSDAVTILASKAFEHLALAKQVELIQAISQTCHSFQHRQAEIVADLIADQYPRMLKHNELQMTAAFAVYNSLYGLYWMGAQSLGQMKKIDASAVAPFEKYIAGEISALPPITISPLPSGTSLRIAYLCHYAHFLSGNAVGTIMHSVLKAHANLSGRHVFLYAVQWLKEEFVTALEGTGVTVRAFPQGHAFDRQEEIVDQMLEDGIEVVITDIPSPIATYLYTRRVAPVQMWLEMGYPYWSIAGLDWVIMQEKDRMYDFGIPADRYSLVNLKQEEATLIQECDPDALAAARDGLPPTGTIFSVFGRLIKITSAYLDAVRRILQIAPQAHFLCVGTGDPRLIYELLDDDRLRGRITFLLRTVDLNVFGRVVDVFLDTSPFISGLACREVAIHSTPIVALQTPVAELMMTKERDPLLIAENWEQYVEIAVRLSTDAEFYKTHAEEAVRVARKSTNVGLTVEGIEQAITLAINYRRQILDTRLLN